MAYERSKAGEKFARQALTKAVVYFKDGNARTFNSRDYARDAALPNKDLGIARLKKMINGWARQIETALIYDKASDSEIDRFRDGAWL